MVRHQIDRHTLRAVRLTSGDMQISCHSSPPGKCPTFGSLLNDVRFFGRKQNIERSGGGDINATSANHYKSWPKGNLYMKILLANPNTTDVVTQRMAAVARGAASPGTEIVAVTATTGVPYIATRAEAVLGASALFDLLGRHAHGMDAVIVAAFGDPGLEAARELLPIPVVGMAEAAMLTACMLGRRFAVVTFAPSLCAWFHDSIDHVGLRQRCSGVHCLDEPFADIASVAEEKRVKLVALCRTAVAAGAEVCILAGAPLAGLAASIADADSGSARGRCCGCDAPGGNLGCTASTEGLRGRLSSPGSEAYDRNQRHCGRTIRRFAMMRSMADILIRANRSVK